MHRSSFLIMLAFIASLMCLRAVAATPVEYDDDAPDKDYVWVDDTQRDDGPPTKGFYRERSIDGYTWVDAHYNEQGAWIEPDWVPVKERPGYMWVPGHAGPDGYWVMGHWREAELADHVWVAPTIVAGVWVHGYWRPFAPRAGFIWVPGHGGPGGVFINGHWRPSARAGFVWTEGQWRYGDWMPGYWKPLHARPGYLWAPGYWGPRGWVEGYWRPGLRVGYHWTEGFWGPRGWMAGVWVKGPRPVVVRRYARVVPVRQMHILRAGRVHRIDKPKQFAKGTAQKRLGNKQERVGKRLERRGDATGNTRLEHKGERLQARGERNQVKGQQKRHNAR